MVKRTGDTVTYGVTVLSTYVRTRATGKIPFVPGARLFLSPRVLRLLS